MTTIITRAGKGSALTFTELDNNFTNLNTELASAVNQRAYRNILGNADFKLARFATSLSDVTYIRSVPDMWYWNRDGSGGSCTVSRQSFTPGQTDVPGNPEFFCKVNKTSAGSGSTFEIFYHFIEDARTFANEQITLSFYAKASGAITLPAVSFSQDFGTGGSPSTRVDTTIASNVAITTSWQRFTYTFTPPSVSGKTFGTNQNSFAILAFNMPLNVTYNFDVADVQLEKGASASSFERKPVEVELIAANRWMQPAKFCTHMRATSTTQMTLNVQLEGRLYSALGGATLNTGSVIADDGSVNFVANSPTVVSTNGSTSGARVVIGGFSGLTLGDRFGLASTDRVFITNNMI